MADKTQDEPMISIGCAKCGEPIQISTKDFVEMNKEGVTTVKHEICPRDAKVFPTYRLRIEVWKKDPTKDGEEMLVSAGANVEAQTFKAAAPELQQEIEAQWAKIIPLAHVAEQG